MGVRAWKRDYECTTDTCDFVAFGEIEFSPKPDTQCPVCRKKRALKVLKNELVEL